MLCAAPAALAVCLGAFGAHGLKKRIADPQMLKNWDTAAHYHLIHSVVLLHGRLSSSLHNLLPARRFLGRASAYALTNTPRSCNAQGALGVPAAHSGHDSLLG